MRPRGAAAPDHPVAVDSIYRKNVRARIRVMIKRILRKYGCPPKRPEKATLTVLDQAELLCESWV